MTARDTLLEAFQASAGWGDASRAMLAGDASNRKYYRLTGGPVGAGAVLMDAPPEKGEDVRPFIAVAEHLAGLGLSAPRLFARDETHGFLLLEDLGDDLYARLLKSDPSREAELYAAATDLVAEVNRAPVPDFLAPYEPDMPRLAALSFDWYQRGALGTVDAAARAAFIDAATAALTAMPDLGRALIQRDYHAENLIWLPGRKGAARVGLLDFQDARSGPAVYDLISLLEDARRDVSAETGEAMRARFCAASGASREAFDHSAAVVGLLRNLRILGVFARLSLHFGKPHYVDLIPRVWGHIQRDAAHPALAALAGPLATLPEPNRAILDRLKALCGTVPTL